MKDARRGSKWAVVAVAGGAALYLLILFLWIPWVESKKVTALIGQTRAEVHQKLGPPGRGWVDGGFECEHEFPCDGGSLGGPVELYSFERQGWYLYYDAVERLRAAEVVRLPPLDGGTWRRGP